MKPKYQQSVTFKKISSTAGAYRVVATIGNTFFQMDDTVGMRDIESFRNNHPDVKVILKGSVK